MPFADEPTEAFQLARARLLATDSRLDSDVRAVIHVIREAPDLGEVIPEDDGILAFSTESPGNLDPVVLYYSVDYGRELVRLQYVETSPFELGDLLDDLPD